MAEHDKWAHIWDDILTGGALRWKDGVGPEVFKREYEYVREQGALSEGGRVLVPLAGDCVFVPLAFGKGHGVTAIELVGQACEALRKSFGDGVSFQEAPAPDGTPADSKLWTAQDGNVRVWQSDIFKPLESEFASADLIYDKDAFGAIPIDRRDDYVSMMAKYLKPNSFVLLEVKNKKVNQDQGPPFHITLEDVKATWGVQGFHVVDHVDVFYPLPSKDFTQQAFLLRHV